MSTSKSEADFWDYAHDREFRDAMRDGVDRLRDTISTSISKAASITQISPPNLRYWESKGIVQLDPGSRPKEYDRHALLRLIAANSLNALHECSPSAIARILDEVSQAELEDLSRALASVGLDTETETIIDNVADHAVARFFVPRLVNVLLRQLLDSCHFGMLVFPVDDVALAFLREKPSVLFERLRGRSPLPGRWLVASVEQGRAVAVMRREFLYLDAPEDYDVDVRPIIPASPAYSLEFEPLNAIVFKAKRKNDERFVDDSHIDEIPLHVAFIADLAISLARDFYDTAGDTSFSWVSPSALSGRLSSIAELIMKLDKQGLWTFCCVLLPQSEMVPRPQRTLVVQGQSQRSPYEIGSTLLQANSGLSGFAYHTGQIANIPMVKEWTGDPTIAYMYEREASTKSAIAIPTGVSGAANGAIYIAASEPSAFDNVAERALGILAQLVGGYIERSKAANDLERWVADFQSQPEVLDPLFASFRSHDAFLRELGDWLERMPDRFTVIGFDMDHSSAIAEIYGDAEVRKAWSEMGQRIMRSLSDLVPEKQIPVFRTLHDRYVFVLSCALNEALELVADIKARIEERPLELELSDGEYRAYRITVKVGVVSPVDFLGDRSQPQSAAETQHSIQLITQQLNGAIRRAKSRGGRTICYWDAHAGQFLCQDR